MMKCYEPGEARPPFRKVLYLRQPYPDNYVDTSFLSSLKRNANLPPPSLPHLLRQTLPITQHLSATLLFLVVFVLLSTHRLSASSLLVICAALAVFFRLWAVALALPGGAGIGPRGAVPLTALYLLSPALKTLTRATTSDSIWPLSVGLFFLHLLLSDYRAIPLSSSFSLRRLHPWSEGGREGEGRLAPRAPLPSTVSLTAALSASTVLASRLSSNTSVFALLLFATLWFGPFPLLRSSLPLKPTLILTWALASAALVGLRALEAPAATGMAAAAMFGTAVAAPVLRGALEARYKDRMSGPWDVVRPRVGAGARLLRIALELLRRKGTLVTLGNASGPVAPFAPLKLGPKNLKVCRPVLIQYVHTQSEYQTYANELFALIQSGELKLAVHGEDPLSARGVKSRVA
ncbi:hypothetical protein JCM10213_000187 [Rhodosporidiobolus nylandii]